MFTKSSLPLVFQDCRLTFFIGLAELLTFPFGDEPITIKNQEDPAGCGWLYRADSGFINDYAKVSPLEDYAETLTHFLLKPEGLKKKAPQKHLFMHYLYGPPY